jgi:hypothetical protein
MGWGFRNGCAGWNACSEDESEPEFGSGVHGVIEVIRMPADKYDEGFNYD